MRWANVKFFGLAAALVCWLAALAAAGDASCCFDRTRHKSALIALLNYNPNLAPKLKKDFLCQRAYLTAFCRMFVQEGGYYAARAAKVLDIADPETEPVALLARELNGRLPDNGKPRALQMASVVALAYTAPSPSGLYAAMHAARLVEADPDTGAVARAVYSFLVNVIGGQEPDKRALLNIAALNAEDKKVAMAIRAVPLRGWHNLEPENTSVGRLCRTLHIWFRAGNWRAAVREGQRLLRYNESRRFLGIITAAWFDLRALPDELVWGITSDRQFVELGSALYRLAQEQILIQIPRNLVLPDLAAAPAIQTSSASSSSPAITSTETALATSAAPNLPAAPSDPTQPAGPQNLSSLPFTTVSNAPRHHPARWPSVATTVVLPTSEYLRVSFPLD
jgi:hypothetical protein